MTFQNTYLTPIYIDRQAHGPIDGSESRELPKPPGEENYDRINAFVRESQVRNGESFSGGSSNGSYPKNQRSQGQGSGSGSGMQNVAFDELMERQNSTQESVARSVISSPSGGSVGGSGGGSYIGAAPEAHRFKKPAPLPGTQRQNQNLVVFQPDGSYITPHGYNPPQAQQFELTQEHVGSDDSKGSNQGYLRSVQNSDNNQM